MTDNNCDDITSVEVSIVPPKDKYEAKQTAKNRRFALKNKRHVVQHNYHDHSDDTPVDKQSAKCNWDWPVTVESDNLDNSSKQEPKCGAFVQFPRKLHELLDTIEADGLADVISWQPHGRAFLIHKTSDFATMVMPRYFRQTKIASFRRQLNLYGFLRITQGRDKGAYYHELFLRGRSFLVDRIKRQKMKGTMVKSAASPDTEPDFYYMPFVAVTSNPATTILAPSEDVSRFDIPKTPRATSPWPTPWPTLSLAVPVSPMAEDLPKPKANIFGQAFVSKSDLDERSFEERPFHYLASSQSVTISFDDWMLEDNLSAIEPLQDTAEDYSDYANLEDDEMYALLQDVLSY